MNHPDWQNPQVTNINREAPRATLVPFPSEGLALNGERGLRCSCDQRVPTLP